MEKYLPNAGVSYDWCYLVRMASEVRTTTHCEITEY